MTRDAETLRRAASNIRDDFGFRPSGDRFMFAVAIWLDAEADALDARNAAGEGRARFTWHHALTVANAYLERTP